MIVLKFLLFPGMATLACKKDTDSRLKWMLQQDFISKNKTFPNAVTGLWNSKWVLCIDLWSERWCTFKATAETESSTLRRTIHGGSVLISGNSAILRGTEEASSTFLHLCKGGLSQEKTQPGEDTARRTIYKAGH